MLVPGTSLLPAASLPDFDRAKPILVEPFQWLEGQRAFVRAEGTPRQDIAAYDLGAGRRTILIESGALRPAGSRETLTIDDFAFSSDASNLLILTNAQPVWRDKTQGEYWLLDRSNGSLRRLSSDSGAPLRFAKFSPDGLRVAYVRNNDIFVKSRNGNEIVQLTSNGSDRIFKGTSDWVDEEELALREGFHWRPDSKRMS